MSDEPSVSAPGDSQGTALLAAARAGQVERLRDLLDRGAEIEHRSSDGTTALISAARGGHAPAVRALLERGALCDQYDNNGDTALLVAAQGGWLDAVQELLGRGAAIDHQNREGHTALFLAASHPATLAHPDGTISPRHEGHDAVVRELLARGAETEYSEYHEFGGRQPVSAAARMDNVAAVLDLLAAGARFLSDEKVGVDLLNRLAAQGHVKELQAILDRGGDSFAIDETDNRGRTALSTAIAARQHAAVLALLDRGAAISDADRTMVEEWLRWFEAQAEQAYDKMDDAPGSAAGHYADAKDFLSDGLALARRFHQQDWVTRINARLAHIKAVFRSQF